jgi:hypothetical protein
MSGPKADPVTHTLTLVGIREDKSTHTFYRWAFVGTAASLAVTAFDEAIGVAGVAPGFVAWRLECACKWASVDAQRPIELAGLGFVHLLAARL